MRTLTKQTNNIAESDTNSSQDVVERENHIHYNYVHVYTYNYLRIWHY